MITVIGGTLLLGGTLAVSVAWFGLRRQEAWALVALALGVLLAVALGGSPSRTTGGPESASV